MATRSFLPNTDLGLLAWAQNFYAVANVAPTTFNLTAALLTSFNTLVTAYQTALAACDAGVRNKAAVASKKQAAANLKANARLLANAVNAGAAVTNAQKLTLGLTVRAMPSPVPPPADAPQVDVVSVVGRTVRIRLHDAATAGKRGKPNGVKGAMVWSYVGATAPTDPLLYRCEGNTTQPVFDIAFPETVAAGATVWVTAQWFNERAQNGPAATPVNAVMQYGMAMAG